MPTITPNEPYIYVSVSYTYGTMSNWTYRAVPHGITALNGKYLYVRVDRNGITTISASTDRTGLWTGDALVSMKGFKRAMTRLSALYGVRVMVDSDSRYSCNDRARELFGVYGVYVPPPPPVEATKHPVALLKEAYAEYHARVRGENTGTRLGYCALADGCDNIAARIARTDSGAFVATCKAHEPIPADVIADAVAIVRSNGKVYAKEALNFGFAPAVFARAVREGMLRLIAEGPYTRWEMATTLPGGSATSPMFHKHKPTSVARRRNRGGIR